MKKEYKSETLLSRLEKYDQKYYEQISQKSNINFGYGMRAYHAIKVSNPPEFKTREKAEEVAEELKKRGIKFRTNFLKINNL